MDKRKVARELLRIARQIISFDEKKKNTTTTNKKKWNTISVRMKNGKIKRVPIKGVRIIIEDNTEEHYGLEYTCTPYALSASPKVTPIPKADRTYALDEVKGYVSRGNVDYEIRKDKKSDPTEIKMTKPEAEQVILQLSDSNYSKSYDRIPENPKCQFPVDIYKVKSYLRKRVDIPIDLYIKFYIDYAKELVVIVSFHGKEKKKRQKQWKSTFLTKI